MASTNKTPVYDLPQWLGSDRPATREDLNASFLAIENAIVDVDGKNSALSVRVTNLESSYSDIIDDVATANTTAQEAQTTAEGASVAAGAANTVASNAVNDAAAAQTSADAAGQIAASAQSMAETAQTQAATAASAAQVAQSTANAAQNASNSNATAISTLASAVQTNNENIQTLDDRSILFTNFGTPTVTAMDSNTQITSNTLRYAVSDNGKWLKLYGNVRTGTLGTFGVKVSGIPIAYPDTTYTVDGAGTLFYFSGDSVYSVNNAQISIDSAGYIRLGGATSSQGSFFFSMVAMIIQVGTFGDIAQNPDIEPGA